MFHNHTYHEHEISDTLKNHEPRERRLTAKSKSRPVTKSRPKSYHRSNRTNQIQRQQTSRHQTTKQQTTSRQQQTSRQKQYPTHTLSKGRHLKDKNYEGRYDYKSKKRPHHHQQLQSRQVKSRPREQVHQNRRAQPRPKQSNNTHLNTSSSHTHSHKSHTHSHKTHAHSHKTHQRTSDDPRKSYRSTTSNSTTHPTPSYSKSESESFDPPLLSKHHETPQYRIDHEVKNSVIPNLNLSTYGYSVNGTDTTRQKALYDAVAKEGIGPVKNRVIWLMEKYADKDELFSILSSDLDWLDDYDTSTSRRERFDSQREHIKQKISQRMHEKSKSRRRSLKNRH